MQHDDPALVNHQRMRRDVVVLCCFVMGAASAVLVGWALDIVALKAILPGAITMKANTALGLFALAVAVLLLTGPTSPWRRFCAMALILGVAGLAAGTLAEYVFEYELGIDEALFADRAVPRGAFPPGRLAPISAVCFLLLSGSLALQGRRWFALGRFLNGLTMLLAFQAFVGYALGVRYMFGTAFYTQMALHTAVLFLALCTAILRKHAAQESGYGAALDPADAALRRRLMAAALVVPPAVQGLLQAGHKAGLFLGDFAVVLQVVGNTVLMLLIISRSLTALRRRAVVIKGLETERTHLHAEAQAAQLVRESEERLRLLLESAFDAVVSMDAQGLITGWNIKAETMFGYSKAQVRGKTVGELLVPPALQAVHYAGVKRFLETGRHTILNREVEVEAYRSDGSLLPVRMVITPVRVGVHTSFTAFIADTSERRRSEAEVRAAQLRAEHATSAKSQFLAHMSHEVRTPLNGILGVTDMLLDEPLTAEQRKLTEVIAQAGKQLLGIVNDILDFSKIEAGKLELEARPFFLRKVVQQQVDLMTGRARAKQLDLRCSIHDDVADTVAGDASRLGQILLNLLSNAVKFTEHGSVVLHVDKLDQMTRFTVRDSGVGISPEAGARLFQPFSQADSSTSRRHDGTGLGLVISRGLVVQMGGTMGYESHEGKGSHFWFCLPLHSCAIPQVAKQERLGASVAPLQVAGRVPKILVAEDNPVNQMVITAHLRKLGCNSEVVCNGQEAVLALERQHFDIVLMDCQMPIMDGFAATLAIRAYEGDKRHTPIVAITASALQGDVDQCLMAGMDGHLCKPFTLEEVRGVITQYVIP